MNHAYFVFTVFFALAISSWGLSSSALAMDVFGSDPNSIRVTLSKDQLSASFELCSNGDSCANPQVLGQAGPKNEAQFYSIIELRNQRTYEQLQVVGTVVADVVTVVGCVFTGGAAGVGMLGAGSAYGSAAVFIGAAGTGAAVGAGGAIVLENQFEALNPAEQYRQARVLEDDVITDLPVYLTSSMVQYAHSLDTVLQKLKPVKH